METQLSDRVYYLLYVLTLCLVVSIYNFAEFARFHMAQSSNMREVDHQAFSYVL